MQTVVVRRRTLLTLLLLCGPSTLEAQRRQPEFTQQFVLVSNFWVAGVTTPSRDKNDLKLGREAADKVRDRIEDLVNKRETKIISGYDLREAMIRAGYSGDEPYDLDVVRQQGEVFRADEIVIGSVKRLANNQVRLDASLVLYRDIRMRQPIPAVTANDLDRAAEGLARRIQEARAQLVHQRRCENSLRDGQGTRAVQHARAGFAGSASGVLARTCLVWALRAMNASAGQVLEESNALLAFDPGAFHAIEAAASSLDSLKRRDEAATMWLRLYATDTTNLELAERVVWSLAEGGNSRRAEPLIVKLSDANPDNIRLLRQKWRIANDNRNWALAVNAGERLLTADAEAVTDSIFFQRLATAYRANGQPFKAMEIVVRGVSAFPGDPRLYAIYTQFVKEETDSVLPRGLALFPDNAALLALNARELRAKGQLAEALDASKRAVELDSTITQGRLLIAQAEMELGRPDSALLTLSRAVSAGEDRNAIAQFALAKGNSLLRAANGTESRADFQLAMRFLALADSLKPTPQTKFVLGAAALKVAQTALTDAPKLTSKDESCAISRIGHETIPLARSSLEGGVEISADATKQFLEYLDQLAPYADKQIAAFCPASVPGSSSKGPEIPH
jgi:tetratricopeptide (TPR) repeat protein